MSERTCETCEFWVRQGTEYGDCHRRAPATMQFNVQARQNSYGQFETHMTTLRGAAWPNTHENDWCGEHTPKKDNPDDQQ